ncbi:MAG: rhodanese-like domain-containing protein [Actinomycetota bacterium]
MSNIADASPCAPTGMLVGVRLTIDDLLARARSELVRLTPTELLARMRADDSVVVVDTRTPDNRRAEGVIPGSVHIPLSVLQWAVDPAVGLQNPEIDGFEQHIVVVCNEGYSSSLAAATLRELGFARATDLDGGFRAWAGDELPVSDPQPPEPGELPGRSHREPGGP